MTPRERHGLWVTGELWVIPPVPTSDGPKSMGYRKLWVIRRYGLWGVRLYVAEASLQVHQRNGQPAVKGISAVIFADKAYIVLNGGSHMCYPHVLTSIDL